MFFYRSNQWANTVMMSLVAVSLVACGAGDENPVPPGATITLSSSEYKWDIKAVEDPCFINPDYYHDHLVNISVANSSGQPVGDVNVHLTLDLSGNTFSGFPVMGLFDDLNGNGAREPEELVSINGKGAYTVKTHPYEGSRAVWVRVNLSCPYRGTLSAYSGMASTSMNFIVEEKPADPV